jgi:hypothetical protein
MILDRVSARPQSEARDRRKLSVALATAIAR